MTCRHGDDLLEKFAGTLPEEKAAELDLHLKNCEICRTSLAELESVARRLAPDPGEFDDPDLAKDVGTLIKLERGPSQRRRWLGIPALAAALAAGLAIFALRAPIEDDSYRSRSGSKEDADRWVSIEIFRLDDSGPGYRRVEGDLAADSALAFSVHNRPDSPYRYVMIFAFDGRGETYWYYPAYTREGENPASIEALPAESPRPLGEAIRHELQPGWLRVIGLFSREPLDVRTVEAAIKTAARDKDVERLLIPDTGQHSLLFRVETAR